MKKVVVTKCMVGICHMQVCAKAESTDEEILHECNSANPSGTSLGWCDVIRDDKEHPNMNPIQCKDDPKRKHFMIAC